MRACMRAKSCRKLVPSVMCHRGAAGADAARGEGTSRYRASARFRGRVAALRPSALSPTVPSVGVPATQVCGSRSSVFPFTSCAFDSFFQIIVSFSDSHSYCRSM